MANDRFYRGALLDLYEKKQTQTFSWEAKFLSINNGRFTLSQLRLQGEKELFATHLNLPFERVIIAGDVELKKGQTIYFKASPDFYLQNGVRRGTLKCPIETGSFNVLLSLE